jgi:hypothetical protein
MPSRRTVITGVFLTVTFTAVGLEVWFATDSDPDTLPWTALVADHVPAPVTFAAIAVLVAWIGPHFVEAYASRRKATMGTDTTTIPATPQAGAETEPLVAPASITAAVGALLSLMVAFGLDLTEQQTGAVLAAVTLVAPLVLFFLARRRVFAPATVRAMVVDAADNLQPGETRTVAAEVSVPPPDDPGIIDAARDVPRG